MLHLIWYVIVGFLAGCVAKALLHTHLSITWTIVLGIVGSIIGGAVTHLFSPPSGGGRFHPAGLIVSILGAIQTTTAKGIDFFRLSFRRVVHDDRVSR